MSASTTGLMVLGRQGHGSCLEPHEAVARERLDRLRVELGERACGLGDEAKRRRAALPERALERPLLAHRREAAASARAHLCERTGGAARDAGEADCRTEIHQRL